MIKEYVLIFSFILTIGLWICGLYAFLADNVTLTGTVGFFTVGMLWVYLYLEFEGEVAEGSIKGE